MTKWRHLVEKTRNIADFSARGCQMRNFTTDSESRLKAVCDSNGKPPNLPPRGTETNEPIDAKFGRGNKVGEGTHHAKYHGRRYSGAGSVYGQNITSLDFFFTFFFSSTDLQTTCYGRASPINAHSTRSGPRKCLLGVTSVTFGVRGVRGLKEFKILTPNMGGPI